MTFLWIIEDAPALSRGARSVLTGANGDIYLSAASAWEIAVKYRKGSLPLPQPPEVLIPSQREQRGIRALPIDEASTLRLRQLPNLHGDPFDRMLACQAIEHEMTIVTPDALLRAYPIRTIW